MTSSARARLGIAVAQLGAVAMILGGLGDQLIRELLPTHIALLGSAHGRVSPQVASVVLALLHTVGYALIASGIATLMLLRQLRLSGEPMFAAVSALVVLFAEGANAFHMHQLGLDLFVVPLGIMLLIVLGLLLCSVPRWAFTSER